jgi:hypothetical protein
MSAPTEQPTPEKDTNFKGLEVVPYNEPLNKWIWTDTPLIGMIPKQEPSDLPAMYGEMFTRMELVDIKTSESWSQWIKNKTKNDRKHRKSKMKKRIQEECKHRCYHCLELIEEISGSKCRDKNKPTHFRHRVISSHPSHVCKKQQE